MASDRELKMRIRSVEGIGKITSAMKMVASSQIRKVEQLALEGRAYADGMRKVVRKLSSYFVNFEHPIFAVRPVNNVGLIVIGADNGLCGAYNSNLMRHALKVIDSLAKPPVKIICLGGKAAKGLTKAGYSIDKKILKWEFNPDLAIDISKTCVEWFLSGAVDEILVVYTNAISMLKCETATFQLLPFKHLKHGRDLAIGEVNDSADLGFEQLDLRKEIKRREDEDDDTSSGSDYLFEPDAESVMNVIIPDYFKSVVVQLLLESKTSELGSRLKAMTNATENAEKLASELTLQYYRVRQNNITTEIIEISSGAEALKG